MLTYKTNDLIKKAQALCDLKNNSFLTNEASIQLLNDSYIQCYQKLIDIKHDDFLITVDVENNSEIPDNLYQIAEVYYIYKDNPFKKYNLVKNRDYVIKNNHILFKDNYNNCSYCIDYYPIPDKLTLNDDGIDSHDFEVPSNGVNTSTSQFVQVGKYLYVTSSTKVYVLEYGKSKWIEHNISGVTDVFATNDYVAFNTSSGSYVFDKAGNKTFVSTVYGLNTFNADTKTYSYTANVTRRVIIGGVDYDFSTAYEAIKWNNGVFICTNNDDMDIITSTTVSKSFSNPVCISKVIDDKNFIYVEALSSSNVLKKYTFTQVFTPEDGTSILTVPNNAFYSLLSYDLAVMIKTIAGEDISALSVLRDNAYMTFCDTMKKDITPYVIEDVYNNGSNWWF